MIDGIDETTGAKCISHLRKKLGTAFRGLGLIEIDDREVSEFDCNNDTFDGHIYCEVHAYGSPGSAAEGRIGHIQAETS
jgi:hypothetical protein